jgi:hypothetical protein
VVAFFQQLLCFRLVLVSKVLVKDLEMMVILNPPVAHLSFRALMKAPHRLSPHLFLEAFSLAGDPLLMALCYEALELRLCSLRASGRQLYDWPPSLVGEHSFDPPDKKRDGLRLMASP